METPESREKKALKKYLDEIGAFHRWPVPNGYGKADIDCHACIHGTFWALELKKPGAEPTPAQYRTLKEAAVADCQVCWGTADVIIAAIEAWMRRRANGGLVGEAPSNVWAPLS